MQDGWRLSLRSSVLHHSRDRPLRTTCRGSLTSSTCSRLNVFSWCAPCKGGAFPVGASPTRHPLQPEATGAIVEVTKRLKPSVKRVTKYGDSASVQAVTRVNAEQASKKTMRRPT